MLEYLVFRLLSLLAPKIPPRVAYWLCDSIGDVAYWLLGSRRRIVRRNLSTVLGGQPPDLDRRTRQLFREGVKYYYDTFRVPALSDEELERLIDMQGWENLQGALRKGKGALVLTAHLGSPALVAQILAVRKCKVTTVAEPLQNRKLLDLMMSVRGSRGIRLVPFGPTVTRELVEALGRNEVVGIVADRDVSRSGVGVRFFGVETTLPAGPVMLGLRTGAALLPAFTYRLADGRFSAQIGSPMELDRTGNLREDLRRNTQKLAGVMEEAIRRCPEQWIVFEPNWPEEDAGARMGAST